MVVSKEMGPPVSSGLRSWLIPGYSLETLQRGASRLQWQRIWKENIEIKQGRLSFLHRGLQVRKIKVSNSQALNIPLKLFPTMRLHSTFHTGPNGREPGRCAMMETTAFLPKLENSQRKKRPWRSWWVNKYYWALKKKIIKKAEVTDVKELERFQGCPTCQWIEPKYKHP